MKKGIILLLLLVPLLASTNTNWEPEVDLTFDYETAAYPKGFKSLTIGYPCVIISEYRFNIMLRDAIYGQVSRNKLVPDYKAGLAAAQAKADAAALVRDSLQREVTDLTKQVHRRNGLIIAGTIGGGIIGIGLTIGLYSIVNKYK